MSFEAWLEQFVCVLIDCGMPPRQAARYNNEYQSDAHAHWLSGTTPEDAAAAELM